MYHISGRIRCWQLSWGLRIKRRYYIFKKMPDLGVNYFIREYTLDDENRTPIRSFYTELVFVFSHDLNRVWVNFKQTTQQKQMHWIKTCWLWNDYSLISPHANVITTINKKRSCYWSLHVVMCRNDSGHDHPSETLDVSQVWWEQNFGTTQRSTRGILQGNIKSNRHFVRPRGLSFFGLVEIFVGMKQ